jgi:predicted TIM-barrel fold metal-dependent hydrolase
MENAQLISSGAIAIPELRGIPNPAYRRSQPVVVRPPGTIVISADGHWLEGDIWVDRFPAHLKDRAPRLVFQQGGWQLSFGGKTPPISDEAAVLCDAFECMEGMSDVNARLRDLASEGVEKELLFPQRLFALCMHGELEMREWTFGAYNDHMSEICAKAPDQLFYAGIPNYWDPAAAADSVQRLVAQGARALMVPIQPQTDIDGEPIQWASPKMDTFWTAVANSGRPACFHIGEKLNVFGAGAVGNSIFTQMQGFRMSWGGLTFGGVFDRHPNLQVVFAEGGISWVAGALHDADMIFHSYQSILNPKLLHEPSWYWFQHCYATFMTDPPGLELLHRIDANRVMWSLDYPHFESAVGYAQSAISAVFAATTVENAQKIVGGTALELFDMSAHD